MNNAVERTHNHFPAGYTSRRGFIALGRTCPEDGSTCYQFAIVAFERIGTGTVTFTPVTYSVAAGSKTVLPPTPALLAGSPLIDATTGESAMVVDATTLDRSFSSAKAEATGFMVTEGSETATPAMGPPLVCKVVLKP
jgi:hypothetical protein